MVYSEFSLTFKTNKTVRITFGFNCRNKDHYGIMMYHRNRLIKAYEKVGCQLRVSLYLKMSESFIKVRITCYGSNVK